MKSWNCVVIVLTSFLQRLAVLQAADTLANHSFNGYRPGFSPKPNQSSDAVVDVKVGLRIRVGGVLHHTPSLMDGWLLSEWQGLKASLPEGIPSLLLTQAVTGKQILGYRLITAHRQAGFGSGGALCIQPESHSAWLGLLFRNHSHVDMKFWIHNRHWLMQSYGSFVLQNCHQ